jgi:hypothetical protein
MFTPSVTIRGRSGPVRTGPPLAVRPHAARASAFTHAPRQRRARYPVRAQSSWVHRFRAPTCVGGNRARDGVLGEPSSRAGRTTNPTLPIRHLQNRMIHDCAGGTKPASHRCQVGVECPAAVPLWLHRSPADTLRGVGRSRFPAPWCSARAPSTSAAPFLIVIATASGSCCAGESPTQSLAERPGPRWSR